jgi:uracil-DNA glycosylase
MKTDWNPILREQLEQPYWAELQAFLAKERAEHVVFPPNNEVFSALHMTPFGDVRVVILGQDPYHGPGQAHGLSFSVKPGVPTPPSLVNMFKELHADVGCPIPKSGNLAGWARQGVLLLNATLTVRAHTAASHQGKGWETFTDAVISAVNSKPERVVFVLWGAFARKKRNLIDIDRHVIVESAHPSPLSARTGFFGSKPYSAVNSALVEVGLAPIDWSQTHSLTS